MLLFVPVPRQRFHRKKSMTSTSMDTAGPSCSSRSPSLPTCGISLSKQVTLHTEFMKQLAICNSLLEKGGITKETYDLQHTILKENFRVITEVRLLLNLNPMPM